MIFFLFFQQNGCQDPFYKSQTDVDIRFSFCFFLQYSRCRDLFHTSLKRMSTSVSSFFLFFFNASDVEIRFEKYETDFDICFIFLYFLLFVIYLRICGFRSWLYTQ